MDDDSPPASFTTQNDSESSSEDRDPGEEYANSWDYNSSGTDGTRDGCLDQGCAWQENIPPGGSRIEQADAKEIANESTGRKLEGKYKQAKYQYSELKRVKYDTKFRRYKDSRSHE
jgi:hypothetical protein